MKCVHCGRVKGDHRAKTLHCPIGRKSRTLGVTQYSETKVFTSKTSDTLLKAFDVLLNLKD